MSLAGNNGLRIADKTDDDGNLVETFVEVIVIGNLSVSDSAEIQLDPWGLCKGVRQIIRR